ncbi:MAG TPA: hypothetical protein ENJ41_07875 [Oceanospirillales bacterium]|nr:hypothetical protein [Oceanospirillales bacterium]
MSDQSSQINQNQLPRTAPVIIGLLAILALIGFIGLYAETIHFSKLDSWSLILLLLIAFVVLTGYGITGMWRGILIDYRNKLSLARLQVLAWTLLILSAYLAAVLLNISLGGDDILNITVPSELWTVMGISTGSAIGASVILAQKDKKQVTADGKVSQQSVLHTHDAPQKALWGDMLKGDDQALADVVDIGKLQMFLFTFILILAYAAVLAKQFQSGNVITELPEIGEGMNVLLGISHMGYLSKKAIMRK